MSQLGERFRQARESRGLSLAQVAADTRILLQSLIALEEGVYNRLPSDVVTRGFIRNYAQYLDLSSEELIELYRQERDISDKIRIVPATNMPPMRSYVLPNFFVVFFITVALVGLSYVTLNAFGRVGDSEIANAPPAITSTLATTVAAPVASEVASTFAPTTESSPLPTSTALIAGVGATDVPIATATATPEAPIVVEVSIPPGEGESWLRIESDGATVYERIMREGEKEVFLAQRRVSIRAGNPPVVRVSVNGLGQGSLGQVSGQPVNWIWPPQ